MAHYLKACPRQRSAKLEGLCFYELQRSAVTDGVRSEVSGCLHWHFSFWVSPTSNNSALLTVSTGSEDMKTFSGTQKMQLSFLSTNCQVYSVKSTCFSIRTARAGPLFLTFVNPWGSCHKGFSLDDCGACVWAAWGDWGGWKWQVFASTEAICCYTTSHPQILGLKQQKCLTSHYSVDSLSSSQGLVQDGFHVV